MSEDPLIWGEAVADSHAGFAGFTLGQDNTIYLFIF